MISLRNVEGADLDVFFEQQTDPESNRMAAFTAKDPSERDAFESRWRGILDDESIVKKTILFDGRVAGNVLSFERSGERMVGYWVGRDFWGKGVATKALSRFLDLVKTRPLYAHAAKDNSASIRVLEKCGFRLSGEDRGFSNVRGREVEEFIFVLS